MGLNPEDSVVDANLKIFNTRNIYVCGGGVFPSSGSINPTLTIVALALRLSRHLLNLVNPIEQPR
jgi:choline dehydrogenase-like flavoprotein